MNGPTRDSGSFSVRSDNKEALDKPETLESLITRAQSGDKIAYTALLKEASFIIRGFLASRVSNPDWIDEITQESLISLHKSLHTYSQDRPFKPWLYAIVNFRKTDFFRKRYSQRYDKRADMDDPAFIRDHVENPAYTGELKDVERFFAKLSRKQRLVFAKMRIEGYTASEIARQTGLSETNIKVIVHRIQKRLDVYSKG